MDLITPLLSGGFAGAAVVGLLFKFLIQHRLEKSIKQHQHDLDAKKDSLQAELAVYTEHAKLKFINHRQKAIAALEAVYGSFVRTSFPRHGFKKSFSNPKFESSEEELNSVYFQIFSENFQAFDRAFKAITAAYQCTEENSIYLEHELEDQVAAALKDVNSCYQKWHFDLKAAHNSAQVLFKNNSLDHSTRTMNFEAFYTELSADWIRITVPVKTALKIKVRRLLSPEST